MFYCNFSGKPMIEELTSNTKNSLKLNFLFAQNNQKVKMIGVNLQKQLQIKQPSTNYMHNKFEHSFNSKIKMVIIITDFAMECKN